MKMYDDEFYTQYPYMLIRDENGLPTIMHIISPKEDNTECFKRFKEKTWKNIRVFKERYKKTSEPWYIPRIKEQKRTLKTMQIVKTTDFEIMLKKAILAKPIHEITKEQYHDALNLLPPVNWYRVGDFEMFCMSERITGSYTTQYAHDTLTGKYYLKTVDMDDPSTWIHNFFEETQYQDRK